jgi:hypothetical protein
MESTILLSMSACVGFAVYYEMVGVTYLEHVTSSAIYVSLSTRCFCVGDCYDWFLIAIFNVLV